MKPTFKPYTLQLGISKSGKGARMFSKDGKKVMFCNLERLKEFCAGNAEDVVFTVGLYTEKEQSTFDNLCDDDLND